MELVSLSLGSMIEKMANFTGQPHNLVLRINIRQNNHKAHHCGAIHPRK
jgi:hypothetical protein